MTTPRERALDNVKRLVFRALAGTDASVYLIGSCATGRAQRSSDMDVAIDAEAPLPAGLIAGLREALEESTIPYFVDVVDLGAVDPEFRRRVLGQAVEWTARWQD